MGEDSEELSTSGSGSSNSTISFSSAMDNTESPPSSPEEMPSYQPLLQEGGSSHTQDICELDATLSGYRSVRCRQVLFHLVNLLLLGLPWLVCRWNPHYKVKLQCVPSPLRIADWVILSFTKEEIHTHHSCKVETDPGHFLPEEFTSKATKTLVHQDSKTPLFSSNISSDSVLKHFGYRNHKFIWDEGNDSFRKLSGLDNVSCSKLTEDFPGLSHPKRMELRSVYGTNSIDVEVKSYGQLLVDEVLNPFYVFQIFSVILWCFDEYVYYASCVLLISAISILIALLETKRQSKMLREMAQSSEHSRVSVKHPDGQEEEISSRDLVPGDVVLIPPDGFIMPCDAVLIYGNCIVNESMLTGESVPVQKSALTPSDLLYDTDTHRRHTLFCGTQVIQTRFYPGNKVSCVVVKTGFSTTKGELIHSILFPKEIDFKFYADAMRFVTLLFGLATVGMGYCIYLYLSRGTAWYITLVRVLDIVTIVVPPALPAAMTVGTVYAQNRLKQKLIFCISPPRINFCGKLKLICFDKTGTLTEEGLDLLCVLPTTTPEAGTTTSEPPEYQEFLSPLADPSLLPPNSPLLLALATCHSLTYIHSRLVGDPLDLKMFACTKFQLEEPLMNMADDTKKFDLLTPTVVKRDGVELGILREFEFTPQLQRMSVVAKSLESVEMETSGPPEMLLYCKGAPEKIRALCEPTSIPHNFDKVLDSFTLKGYRVLALGSRKLSDIKWHQIQRVSRDVVECRLKFCGFLVMQNSLKPATTKVISELNDASFRSVMVTGDNMLTALSVARECGIIPSCDKVLVVNVTQENHVQFTLAAQHYQDTEEPLPPTTSTSPSNNNTKQRSRSKRSSFDPEFTVDQPDSTELLSRHSLHPTSGSGGEDPAIDLDGLVPISTPTTQFTKDTVLQLQEHSNSNYHFVLTGRTFSLLLEEVAPTNPNLVERIVAKGTVYARMSPENKSQLVEALQKLDYIVGMCGDGANDCSALKMAHVGISLSEAEASVAAPFTSKVPDISCVPNLIREGRCALVTSFGIFKYMALYSLVQFSSVILLYSHETNLADTQFLYIDLGITTTIAIVMGRTEPYGRLVSQRPMGSLVSFQNVFSLLVQVLISTSVQAAALHHLKVQPWFAPVNPSSPDELITLCWETTTIFSVSAFQYLILALVFSKGPPFRKPFYSNGLFVLCYVFLTALTIVLVVHPVDFLSAFFHLEPISEQTTNFRLTLLLFPAVNIVSSLLFEHRLTIRMVKRLGRIVLRKKQKNQYKQTLKELDEDLSWPPISN